MNKLEEYKENWANDKWSKSDNCPDFHMSQKDMNEVLQEGFDAAIALDLPVKFAEWKDKEGYIKASNGFYSKEPPIAGKQTWFTVEELYKYWIDNIYKPE